MGFFCSIHLSISYLFGFWVETYFLIDWASRKGWDQVWWGLQVCSRRYKHMVEVRRCWSSSLLKISRLELSKFLYTLIVLHSGFLYRWEAHGFFIFYLLRDVPQNLMSLSFFFSFYSLIYFKLLISFVTWTCMLKGWNMSWNWCDYLLNNFLFNLIKISRSNWKYIKEDFFSYKFVLRSVKVLAYDLHL